MRQHPLGLIALLKALSGAPFLSRSSCQMAEM